MFKKIFVGLIAISLVGCATAPKIVHPVAPTESLKSKYRKTVEVVLVDCQERTVWVKIYSGNNYNNMKTVKEKESFSVVETTDTGERFEVNGCYGKTGDRFKISY